MTNQTTDNKQETFKIWSYSDYKKSLAYDNRSRLNEWQHKKLELEQDIKRLKEQLKNLKSSKPCKKKPSFEGYSHHVILQRNGAKNYNWLPIENKDSRKVQQ